MSFTAEETALASLSIIDDTSLTTEDTPLSTLLTIEDKSLLSELTIPDEATPSSIFPSSDEHETNEVKRIKQVAKHKKLL